MTKNKYSKPGLDTMVYGKVPPQSKELESAILGAIMLEKGAMDRVAEYLTPAAFYIDANSRIFSALVRMHRLYKPIDLLTLVEELTGTGELDTVGGAYYVTTLTNSVVSSANIELHAKIILEKYTKREMIRIGGELVASSYDHTSDVYDIMDSHDKQMAAILMKNTGSHAVSLNTAMANSIHRVEELRHKKQDITGVPSGFPPLDRITHGWQPTDLIILAARPAVGKTALALNLALSAIKSIVPVAFFSLEMSIGQLVNRIISAESGVWLDRITNGNLEDHHMKQLYEKAVQPLEDKKLFIDDTPALNIFELRAKCRRLKNKYNIGLVILDYLQLMSGDTNDSRNREREIAQISRGLKQLAKELNIPFIALSQLSREPDKRKGDDKTPKLSDLRESGAIEQDADMVMFMYRPEYYDVTDDHMGESTKGLTKISIAKHRNGNLAMGNEAISLKADLHIQKFSQWDIIEDIKLKPGAGNWRPVSSEESKDDLPF